ncbi:hypothetical protein TNCV_5040031 [Trichonephila clavipes]|nr:hypothetical protein TNCV_5040031 [Trichonephila clavipes]
MTGCTTMQDPGSVTKFFFSMESCKYMMASRRNASLGYILLACTWRVLISYFYSNNLLPENIQALDKNIDAVPLLKSFSHLYRNENPSNMYNRRSLDLLLEMTGTLERRGKVQACALSCPSSPGHSAAAKLYLAWKNSKSDTF